MRSMAGVGITPPKVLGTPKPASSVMISSTLGALLGGTMRGAHQYLDFSASSLMTPPNFGSGAGSCLLLMVVVALGEPSSPVTCWAWALPPAMTVKTAARVVSHLAAMRLDIASPLSPMPPRRRPQAQRSKPRPSSHKRLCHSQENHS